MKSFFAPLLLLPVALAARADVVIEQKVESTALNGNMVMKIRADKARMDMPSLGGQMTVLWDFKAGEVTTLMAAQKVAMKSAIQPKKPVAEGQPKPKATGVVEKVGPYTAEVYEFTAGPTTQKVWVARDFPNAEAVKAEMRKMSGTSPMGFDTSNLDVPGMAVKIQITSPAGPVTVTLVSAKQQPVADSEFVVPPGYKEMGAGALLNAAAGSPPPPPQPGRTAPSAPVASKPAANPAPAAVPAKVSKHWEGRFKELDTNGDGKLTMEEFLAGPMGRKTPEKAKAFFKSIDKKNTGSITSEQFIVAEAAREGTPEAAENTTPPAVPAKPSGAGPAPAAAVLIKGVVLESTSQGVVVRTPSGTLVWLAGSNARVQMTVEISAFKTEPHVYRAANGHQQTIDGYKSEFGPLPSFPR